MRQRIVARDNSPVGIVLLMVGLLLLALGCAGLLALIDDSFARSIASNSTCNYHACSTSEIKTVGAILGVVLGGLGLILTLAGLARWIRRRRARRAGAGGETTGIAGLPGGFTTATASPPPAARVPAWSPAPAA